METRRLDLIVLALVLTLIGLTIAACRPKSTAQPAPTLRPTTATRIVITPSASVSPAAVVGETQEVELVVMEGIVELRRAGATSFTAITGTVKVSDGDTLRTGADGIACITFLDNTEVTLFPNTELKIENCVQRDDDSFFIRLMQTLGRTFNRVNFPDSNSQYEVSTPNGVAAVRGTAFWVEIFPDLKIVSFDSVTGGIIITFTDKDGNLHTVLVKAETMDLDASGNATFRTLDLFCGDGICDDYTGETSRTCPADCR